MMKYEQDLEFKRACERVYSEPTKNNVVQFYCGIGICSQTTNPERKSDLMVSGIEATQDSKNLELRKALEAYKDRSSFRAFYCSQCAEVQDCYNQWGLPKGRKNQKKIEMHFIRCYEKFIEPKQLGPSV